MQRDILNKGRMEITYDEAEQLQVSNEDFMSALSKVREQHCSIQNSKNDP